MDSNFIKRIAPFLVLEILKAHTNENHGLKVTEIVGLLQQDYEVVLERKSVSRILGDLLELSEVPRDYDWKNPMPFSIKFDLIPRSNGDIRENWRICKAFEDSEIRLLMDLVKSVPGYPKDRLTAKLQRLGSNSRKQGLQVETACATNKQMPVTIDCIEQAIQAEKKMSFCYRLYQKGKTENSVVYVVSPYMTAFCEGNYYLVSFNETEGQMACFEVDRIYEAKLMDEHAKDYHMVCSTSLDACLKAYIASSRS